MRAARLKGVLSQIDAMLARDDGEDAAAAAPSAAPSDISVTIGTSAMAEADPTLPKRLSAMVNKSYTEALSDQLPPGGVYNRLSVGDACSRLAMGDDGPRANRVLHIAWRGDQLVGCCSSTYQPPWTEEGCGHWGLVVVDTAAQGTGVASALVHAAEERLAGACEQIQIEYEYTPDHAYSERLFKWYEGKCGFTCVSGRPRGSETMFRKCRKMIPAAARQAGRRRHLQEARRGGETAVPRGGTSS